ncbi:Hypothetical predicted protein [Pelobates cultripes]|uniref:Uncharacterized protein n=1 Tax=Pelobates cultripes TaxID=61616 RepID=A0AAD1W9I0_PELCU|nr:Hypothetical predicted protein [Pelobates cultripes]
MLQRQTAPKMVTRRENEVNRPDSQAGTTAPGDTLISTTPLEAMADQDQQDIAPKGAQTDVGGKLGRSPYRGAVGECTHAGYRGRGSRSQARGAKGERPDAKPTTLTHLPDTESRSRNRRLQEMCQY